MNIFITGIAGFLGSNLSNHFNNLGYETFGVGHRSSSSKKEKELSMKYWIDGDITKKSILELDNKYDIVDFADDLSTATMVGGGAALAYKIARNPKLILELPKNVQAGVRAAPRCAGD